MSLFNKIFLKRIIGKLYCPLKYLKCLILPLNIWSPNYATAWVIRNYRPWNFTMISTIAHDGVLVGICPNFPGLLQVAP
jgi:hypothetical protein